MKLTGVAAIVTGGGSGLGRATAEALAAKGAKVTVFDLNPAAAEEAAKAIGGLAVAGDVADEASAGAALAKAAAAHGAARVLVNCAGIGVAKRVVGREGPHPLADFEKVIRVNLIGTFNMIRLAAAEMGKLEPIEGERGVVISTASIAAYDGQIGQAAYSASKGGVVAMTLPIARELAQSGVRVNAIAPGVFRTALNQKLLDESDRGKELLMRTPMGRFGKTEELVGSAIFLSSDASAFVTGEILVVDGGFLASGVNQ